MLIKSYIYKIKNYFSHLNEFYYSYYLDIPVAHWIYAVLSLAAAASIDPTWKINHLYSTELFPTSVRNMARGVCNMAARLGGVVAPSVSLFINRDYEGMI